VVYDFCRMNIGAALLNPLVFLVSNVSDSKIRAGANKTIMLARRRRRDL
jgi:hypothetical protein